MGLFSCLKLQPQAIKGKVFDEQFPVTLWVTDDKNHIPVLIETKLTVGSARVELTSFSGLLNPVTSFEKKK